MWVKICANTNEQDVLKAASLGADAVGFVFAASPRHVSAAQVRMICAGLPPEVERIGVFPPFDAEVIAAIVEEAGLQTVQLHGGLDLRLADWVRAVVREEISLIHTVAWRVDDPNAGTQVLKQLQELAEEHPNTRVLLDAGIGESSGGLGVAFDWVAARRVLEQVEGLRVIVAGGLTPANVLEAIQQLAPCGVDVASGVERAPGMKDEAKLAAFIAAARTHG